MTTVSVARLSKDMQSHAQELAGKAGLEAQARDRPPDGNDLLFYLSGTTMPMAAFLKDHGLFMDGEGLHFDLAQFSAIREVAAAVISEREAGNQDGTWQRFDLSEDEDIDTNGGYILTALAVLELLYDQKGQPSG